VSYLGHVFSADGIQPDPNKVHAVQAWPTPTDVSTRCILLATSTSLLSHACYYFIWQETLQVISTEK